MNIAAFFELPTEKRALNISRGEADEETEIVGDEGCQEGRRESYLAVFEYRLG